LLRSRRAHVQEYLDGRGRYLGDPAGHAAVIDLAMSGELEPTTVLRGGETIDLGGDVSVSVHAIPGHRAGAVAYEIAGSVFVGDSVEMHGAANGFPGYDDPDAYRASLEYLRDAVRPRRMFLGHPYRWEDGHTGGVELDREQAARALQVSLDNEARIRAAVQRHPDDFERIAADLGYTGDRTLEPAPFLTTMHGYRS
jgi:glyoxylase-like metal-dependent hydrolase (beta-lactamase superfamily II)